MFIGGSESNSSASYNVGKHMCTLHVVQTILTNATISKDSDSLKWMVVYGK